MKMWWQLNRNQSSGLDAAWSCEYLWNGNANVGIKTKYTNQFDCLGIGTAMWYSSVYFTYRRQTHITHSTTDHLQSFRSRKTNKRLCVRNFINSYDCFDRERIYRNYKIVCMHWLGKHNNNRRCYHQLRWRQSHFFLSLFHNCECEKIPFTASSSQPSSSYADRSLCVVYGFNGEFTNNARATRYCAGATRGNHLHFYYYFLWKQTFFERNTTNKFQYLFWMKSTSECCCCVFV